MNQIQNDPGNNNINLLTIHAGRQNQSSVNWNIPPIGVNDHYQWEVYGAFIMPQMKGRVKSEADIGIVSIRVTESFFDQDVLKRDFFTLHRGQIERSRIVPICLARENSDLSGRTLKGAGWGWEYQEKQQFGITNPRNPEYSSCMTSELSFREYRFKNCDMQKIKANDWECRTDTFPNGYPVAKCRDYFDKTQWTAYRTRQRFKLSRKEFDKLFRRDIMYVPDGSTTINCTRLAWTDWPYGWCELPESTDVDFKWGICSSSCSTHLMKVM